ncbi:MAG: helix-turn-helix domain-containing protein [Mycobacterium sp.]|mgnify:CR=1 FL=1
MAANNWLADRRTEVAAERILDAAGELFAQRPVAAVGMNEIASAAGCSRATLYRYFDSRQALHTAYAHREAHQLHRRTIETLTGIDDPRQRLVTGLVTTLAMVRDSPALQSWFNAADAPIGVQLADQSDVINAMVSAFVVSLGAPGDDAAAVDRKARWLVRVLTSLLLFPGHDADDERAMIEEFLVPIVAPIQR